MIAISAARLLMPAAILEAVLWNRRGPIPPSSVTSRGKELLMLVITTVTSTIVAVPPSLWSRLLPAARREESSVLILIASVIIIIVHRPSLGPVADGRAATAVSMFLGPIIITITSVLVVCCLLLWSRRGPWPRRRHLADLLAG